MVSSPNFVPARQEFTVPHGAKHIPPAAEAQGCTPAGSGTDHSELEAQSTPGARGFIQGLYKCQVWRKAALLHQELSIVNYFCTASALGHLRYPDKL